MIMNQISRRSGTLVMATAPPVVLSPIFTALAVGMSMMAFGLVAGFSEITFGFMSSDTLAWPTLLLASIIFIVSTNYKTVKASWSTLSTRLMSWHRRLWPRGKNSVKSVLLSKAVGLTKAENPKYWLDLFARNFAVARIIGEEECQMRKYQRWYALRPELLGLAETAYQKVCR